MPRIYVTFTNIMAIIYRPCTQPQNTVFWLIFVSKISKKFILKLVTVIAQLVKCRVSNRKLADSRFDFRNGNGSLGPCQRQLKCIFPLGPSIQSQWRPSLTKHLQTVLKKRVLCIGVVRP